MFSPASYKQGFVGLLDDYPGMTCGVWQHRPESIGYVRARSADPFEDPIIQPNYLADPMDRRVLIAGMQLARKLLHTPELAPYFDGDALPGPEAQTDDELLDYARQYGSTAYHLIGTARMGPATDRTTRGGRPVACARAGWAAGGGRVDHAEHAVGEHLLFHDDDCGEGVGHDPGPAAVGPGGGDCGLTVRTGGRSAGGRIRAFSPCVESRNNLSLRGAQRRSNPLPDEPRYARQAGHCFGATRLAMTGFAGTGFAGTGFAGTGLAGCSTHGENALC